MEVHQAEEREKHPNGVKGLEGRWISVRSEKEESG